jgi:hypothetical protein
MDIHKPAAWANIGTFFLTAVMLAVMVWPKQEPPHTPSGSTQSTASKPDPGSPMPMWLMPSAVAFALIVSSALQFAASRSRKSIKTDSNPDTSLTPEAIGRLRAEAAMMHHWEGTAKGTARELEESYRDYKELSQLTTQKIQDLEAKLAEETNAKNDREGRLVPPDPAPRDLWFLAFSRLQTLQRLADLGVLESADQTLLDQRDIVTKTFDPSYV